MKAASATPDLSRYLNRPLVIADGVGVDSTAAKVLLHRLGYKPLAVLHADTGGERDHTLAYLPYIQQWHRQIGWPEIQVVRYVAKDFKHWPPYYTLEDNCLTNGTLPSLAFGFKSCSLKWKKSPQDKWMADQTFAQLIWARGEKLVKVIGYDAGPKDMRRCNHEPHDEDQSRYDYWYILLEAGWDRERCRAEIAAEGLLVPEKSSCFFCPAMKPQEVDTLPPEKLKRIVFLEARAKPRLTSIEGLWRKRILGRRGATPRPGTMTEYILQQRLLPPEDIQQEIKRATTELIPWQIGYAQAQRTGALAEFLRTHRNSDYRHA